MCREKKIIENLHGVQPGNNKYIEMPCYVPGTTLGHSYLAFNLLHLMSNNTNRILSAKDEIGVYRY